MSESQEPGQGDGHDASTDAGKDHREPEVGISDDLLPEDLQPSEDNPLAEGLPDQETVDDLLTGGKHAGPDGPAEGQDGDAGQVTQVTDGSQDE